MAAHTKACQEHPPWRWREVARNTGVKCERRQTSKGFKEALAKSKAKRKEPLP